MARNRNTGLTRTSVFFGFDFRITPREVVPHRGDPFSHPSGSSATTNQDRITRTVSSVGPATADSHIGVRRTLTYVWTTAGVPDPLCLSTNEASVDGLRSWSYTPAGLTQTWITNVSGGYRYATNIAPDLSYTISKFQYGRLLSVTRKDSNDQQIGATYYGYDPHGRQNTVSDARNGTTTYTFSAADLVTKTVTPWASPGFESSSQVTVNNYNQMLQLTNVVYPDSTKSTNWYLLTGELGQAAGSRTYPVGYSYDYAGRIKTMTNWATFPTMGARITTWNYDPGRGWLLSKDYPDPVTGNPPAIAGTTGPSYEYTPGGRLSTRAWCRTGSGGRVSTTYTYGFQDGDLDHKFGDLVAVTYSHDPQNTKNIAYTYDRRGRQITVVQGDITTTLVYNDAGQVLVETNRGGTLDGLAVTNGYDQHLRRTVLAGETPTSEIVRDSMSYDAASRLQTVTDNTTPTPYSATYSYLANSPLVRQVEFTNNGSPRMTTVKNYDFLNRLTRIVSTPTASAGITFDYRYDLANRRTRAGLPDGSYWSYQYDSLGQVRSGSKYWSDMTPVAGEQFQYAFDEIGNRTQTKAGGDASGANPRLANYSANALNQYSTRDVPGALDIIGLALATEIVTVTAPDALNNADPVYRKGEFFRKQLNLDNTSAPFWERVTASATGESSIQGSHFLEQTPEHFTYDDDGNLTSDGRWNYTWDAENRLVFMNPSTTAGPRETITMEYDWKGRRIKKRTFLALPPPSMDLTIEIKFLYDGWNPLAELVGNSVLRTYMWGLDLSGSPQGAGGAGGLLEVVYHGSQTTNCLAAFDGNGNVAALVNAANGATAALYEYGPFGEALRLTGPLVKRNPVRFSTRYEDDETGLIYYGYRYYNGSTGRWLNRDPISEPGGVNLFAACENNLLTKVDWLGEYAPPPVLPPGKYATCKACTCKRVRVDVDRNASPAIGVGGDNRPGTIGAGVAVRITVEVVGDPSQCHCQHHDRGWVEVGFPGITHLDRNADIDRDCASYTDMPGYKNIVPPPPGQSSERYRFAYSLVVGFTCFDSDKESPPTTDSVRVPPGPFWFNFHTDSAGNIALLKNDPPPPYR
jgi:RHS repeat-associated protein